MCYMIMMKNPYWLIRLNSWYNITFGSILISEQICLFKKHLFSQILTFWHFCSSFASLGNHLPTKVFPLIWNCAKQNASTWKVEILKWETFFAFTGKVLIGDIKFWIFAFKCVTSIVEKCCTYIEVMEIEQYLSNNFTLLVPFFAYNLLLNNTLAAFTASLNAKFKVTKFLHAKFQFVDRFMEKAFSSYFSR